VRYSQVRSARLLKKTKNKCKEKKGGGEKKPGDGCSNEEENLKKVGNGLRRKNLLVPKGRDKIEEKEHSVRGAKVGTPSVKKKARQNKEKIA